MSSQHLIPPHVDPAEEEQRLERRAARMVRRKQHRRARLILWGTISTSVLLLGTIGYLYLQILGALAAPAPSTYQAINNITCDSAMQSSYHVHVHLSIYVRGRSVTVPQGIGIGTNPGCFYWLHTHTSNGIIHVEAPAKSASLTLNSFLTIWHDGFASLNFPPELNQASGWKIYLNGQQLPATTPMTAAIPLLSHGLITLEYGTPNLPPDMPNGYQFPPGE